MPRHSRGGQRTAVPGSDQDHQTQTTSTHPLGPKPVFSRVNRTATILQAWIAEPGLHHLPLAVYQGKLTWVGGLLLHSPHDPWDTPRITWRRESRGVSFTCSLKQHTFSIHHESDPCTDMRVSQICHRDPAHIWRNHFSSFHLPGLSADLLCYPAPSLASLLTYCVTPLPSLCRHSWSIFWTHCELLNPVTSSILVNM